jgi:3-hydroxyisobutyrate dehydrogenase
VNSTVNSPRPAVGVIGLGAMGRPMANALLRAGREVIVFDASAAAIERALADGARGATSAAAVAGEAELVITMLPRAEDVHEVVLGAAGVVEGVRPGSVLLDTSTIDAGAVKSLVTPLAERGAVVLDGGVSGSPAMAWEGTVTLMVGGDEAAFERHRETLAALCGKLVYAGALGSAKAMKLANNLVAAVTTAALAEAYTLITRAGVDPRLAFEAMSASWGASAVLVQRPPLPGLVPGTPADDGYAPGFTIDYMAKDVGAILEMARQLGATLPTTELVRGLFVAAGARGDGGLDLSALIRTIDAMADGEG